MKQPSVNGRGRYPKLVEAPKPDPREARVRRDARQLAAALRLAHRAVARLRRDLKKHDCPRKGNRYKTSFHTKTHCVCCGATANPHCGSCDLLRLIQEGIVESPFPPSLMAEQVQTFFREAGFHVAVPRQLEKVLNRWLAKS